jgi:hypothetical protein
MSQERYKQKRRQKRRRNEPDINWPKRSKLSETLAYQQDSDCLYHQGRHHPELSEFVGRLDRKLLGI